MFILFIVLVLFTHEALAGVCIPPTISKVMKTNNTWTDAQGIRRNSYIVNITTGSCAVTSLTIALEPSSGASISSVSNMTASASPLNAVYKLPSSRPSGLPAYNIHTFSFIVSSTYFDPSANVLLLSVNCNGNVVYPAVAVCDVPGNSATCMTLQALQGTGNTSCYSLTSYFDNRISWLNFTGQSPNASCLLLYNKTDCTGSYTTYPAGSYNLVGGSCDNIASSFVFGRTCSDAPVDETNLIFLRLEFTEPYGFPYQYSYFEFVLPDDYTGTCDSNPFNLVSVSISSPGAISTQYSSYLGNYRYRVYFTTGGCGDYVITVTARAGYKVEDNVFHFQVRPKPAPKCCDIFQSNVTCAQSYLMKAGYSQCPIQFCCNDVPNESSTKHEVLAYDSALGCPPNTYRISQLTVDGTSLDFCQRDNTDVHDTAYTYACKPSLVFNEDAANCDGTSGCYNNPPPVCTGMETKFILDTAWATPYAYIGNAKIHMCCAKPPPLKPAFQLGSCYTYNAAHRQTLTTEYPCGSGSVSPGYSVQRVNITAQIQILPVCTHEKTVTSTMVVSNFHCDATIEYVNVSQTTYQTFLNDGPCQTVAALVNDRTGNNYFYFTQDVNTGEIINVWYSAGCLDVTRARVRVLQWFEFKVSPLLVDFVNQTVDNGAFKREKTIKVPSEPKTNKAKRALVTYDWGYECWQRETEFSEGTIYSDEKKRICINNLGLDLVETTANYDTGSPTTNELQHAENAYYYDGMPNIYGDAYTVVEMNTVSDNSASSVTSRGFNNHELADFENLRSSRKRDLRMEKLDWEGFQEEIYEKPADIAQHVQSVMLIALAAPTKSESFASLVDLIEKHPKEAADAMKTYFDSNPNGSIRADQLIFGAMSHAFCSEIENVFLYLLNCTLPAERGAVLLYAVGLIHGHKVSDILVNEMRTRSLAPDTDGHNAMNVLSIMAGQMQNAGHEKRSEPLVNLFEEKLLESEKIGDQNGILHALTSLGNSHSPQAAPHLIRYLDPEVKLPTGTNSHWRTNFNQAAASGLVGIPGSEVTQALVDGLTTHQNTTSVTHALKRSLGHRIRNAHKAMKEKRVLDEQSVPFAKWHISNAYGNDKAILSYYAGIDWLLSLESTRMEGVAGIRASIWANDFQILDAGVFVGTQGFTAFALHLYFFIDVPFINFGRSWMYAVVNYAVKAGRELPIAINANICTPEVESGAPSWVKDVSLPTIPIKSFKYKFAKVFTANILITATLFARVAFQADLKNSILNSKLSEIQLTATLLPGGEIDGEANAKVDGGKIISLGAKVALMVAKISLPSTYAVLLDGSQVCHRTELQLNAMQGALTVFYEVDWLCKFFPRYCSLTYTLGSWPGWSDFRVLTHTSCCGGGNLPNRAINDGAGPTNLMPLDKNVARLPLPPLTIRNGGTATFNINGLYGNLTTVTWSSVAGNLPNTFVERVEESISFVTGCFPTGLSRAPYGCPGGSQTEPASSVKTALRNTGEYGGNGYHAGHILAASLGGSNSDNKNFFIQLGTDNSGDFNNWFERPILHCLGANPTYVAKIVARFYYSALTISPKVRPERYHFVAAFYYPNKTIVPKAASGAPFGCEGLQVWQRGITDNAIQLILGDAHINGKFNN